MRDFQERAQARGIADGRGPQDGQIRTLLALRGSLRSEADAGARVLRRAQRARRERAQAFRGVRAARNGEAGGPEAQGAHGPEPGDRGSDQDPREDRRQGADRQAAQGRCSPEEVTAGFLNRGASPLGLPTRFRLRQGYGETSPKLEEHRRALAGAPCPAPLAWLTRLARSLFG